MLSLLLLMLAVFMITSAMSMSARRRRRLEEERRREMARRMGGGALGGLGGLAMGGLLGAMLGGAWTRTMEYDQERDEWVEAEPEELEKQQPAQRAPEPQRRFERKTPRRAPQATSLTSLLGGAMGGANSEFAVQRPDELVTFADVGGMEKLKEQTRDSIGLLLQHPDQADAYGIEFNGVLLHGPPGVGKTFFAKAIAGEYRLNFIHVSTGDLVAGIQGQ